MINWLSDPWLHTAFTSRRPTVFRFGGMIQMTNQSTKDRGIPDKSPKTDFTIAYLPSESIFKSKHEKTVQMETDFSAAKTRNSNSDFLGPRNYKATAMHHDKWEWVFNGDVPQPVNEHTIASSIEVKWYKYKHMMVDKKLKITIFAIVKSCTAKVTATILFVKTKRTLLNPALK